METLIIVGLRKSGGFLTHTFCGGDGGVGMEGGRWGGRGY